MLLTSLLMDMIKFIASDLPGNFFDNSFVKSLLDFFQWFGVIIFGISFLLMLTTVAEKHTVGEFINVGSVVRGFLQAVFLLSFARPLPILIFKVSQDTAFALVATVSQQAQKSTPQWDWSKNFFSEFIKMFTSGLNALAPSTIVFFIMLFFSFTMTIQLLRLFAIMLIQIVNGYFAITDSMIGDGNAFYTWFQDVLASCLTFALQYVFFIAGAAVVSANQWNGLGPCAAGLSLIVGASAIPAALKKLGYNHGGPTVAGSLAAVGRTAATLAMVGVRG